MLATVPAALDTQSRWMPLGYSSPTEARLERFGPQFMAATIDWPLVTDWWIKHHRGATTPNWDIAATCSIEGRLGLLLVEAKANWPELSRAGKPLSPKASFKSRENHDHIEAAIDSACREWQKHDATISIKRDSHYQLANRLAFASKLACLGLPVVLMYLRFTGDDGIRDAGQPFVSDTDLQSAFSAYIAGTFPASLLERRVSFGAAPVWVISRSRRVVENSPPAE